MNLVVEPLTKKTRARKYNVPTACVTKVMNMSIVVAHPKAVVKPALLASTNRLTAPPINASHVKHAQQVNTERVVVGLTDPDLALHVHQEPTKTMKAQTLVFLAYSAQKASF